MAKTQFLSYEIHLTDPVLVEQLQGTPPGETSTQGTGTTAQKAIIRAPDGAAVEFGTAAVPTLPQLGPADAFSAPSLFSEWFGPGNNFPRTVATFTRKSGGWFGIPLLFGTTTKFYWRGVFAYDPPPQTTEQPGGVGLQRAFMPARRWVDGFQVFEGIDGTATTSKEADMTRAAARAVDGYGLALRGLSVAGSGRRLRNLKDYRGGGASDENESWERLAIRLRKKPSVETDWWRAKAQAAPAAGAQLRILPSGQIAAYNVSSVSVFTLMGTSAALVLDRWYRLDLLMRFNHPKSPTVGSGTFRVFLDGEASLSATVPAASEGLGGSNFKHQSSEIGSDLTSSTTLELDIGFWMNAKIPTKRMDLPPGTGEKIPDVAVPDGQDPEGLGAATYQDRETLTGVDWLNGSRAVLIRPTGLASAHANWTTAWPRLMARPPRPHLITNVPEGLTSVTPLARAAVTTDAARSVGAMPGALGAAAFVVAAYNGRGTTLGRLGYKIATAAEVFVAQLFQAVEPNLGWNSMMYRPSGLRLPDPIVPLELHLEKGNDTTQAKLTHLTATAELIGTFGDEDYDPTLPAALKFPLPFLGIHNAPYPRSVWARSASPPIAPVVIHSGTYVGTAAGLDLAFRAPVHWLWIRKLVPATAVPQTVRWWSSMLANTRDADESPFSWFVSDVLIDPAFVPAGGEDDQAQQTIVRIAGTNLEVNEAGATYVYVAMSDPGQRFLLNGATAHRNDALPATDPLIDATFTPEAGWFHDARPGTSATKRMYYKGPGNALAAMTRLTGVQVTPAVTFGKGTLLMDTGASQNGTQHSMAFALFRMNDGSADPGVGNVVRVTSYVGNGAAGTRTIDLFGGLMPAATGKRPLAAWVLPNTSPNNFWFKDASHTGSTSSEFEAAFAQSVTAIISGAPDQIVVGTTLNANAVTYNVFVLMGGTTAGADGFSAHGEFIPVEPTSPTGSQWGGDPAEPVAGGGAGTGGAGAGDTPGSPGGGADDMTTDLSTTVGSGGPGLTCLAVTTRLVNIALSRIGISKAVVILATELTEEAVLARLHYATAVEATLRDAPWPFATRYATLTLLAGTTTLAVNRDWQFSYRRPSDCVFERRIVVTRDGAVDPSPPPFQLSYDATGGRIFTNQAAAILEYTARPDCSAGRGDPLFRDALAWKLAAQLAGPLSRIADVTKMANEQYAAALARALAVIRPGNPGPRSAVDPSSLDTGTGCLAANVAVVNRALIRIGAQTIANLDTEQSREAEAARVIFEEELKSTLRDYPWAFATKYLGPLTLVRGPASATATVQVWSATQAYVTGDVVKQGATVYYALQANTNQVPPNATVWTTTKTTKANDDWTFAYRYPIDCVAVRRIVKADTRRAYDRQPGQFRVGQDATGNLIFTDTDDAVIEYTARIPCTVGRADALFRDAFAWRLAASLAPSLAQVDPAEVEQLGRGPETAPRERKATEAQLRGRATEAAWRMYYGVIAKARAADANEQQPDPIPGEADWIRDRT